MHKKSGFAAFLQVASQLVNSCSLRSQFPIAQKIGLTKSVISAYENGLRMPSYDVLIAIARIFKVTTDYLLGLEHIREIDLSGLTDEEISALMNLIKAMKHN